ncbi:MAG TPA: glycoside hydrolase family 3 N-terminal domain-containing protein [Pseudogracilibacillus sp.]|nr:glycoside hydrolase family 3 N-terminal domain-containing protein [Pseudogracilibacillus sp.]
MRSKKDWMSLKTRLGQLFIAPYNGREVNGEIVTLINHYRIGGIFLTKEALQKEKQITTMTEKLQQYATVEHPLIISIDQNTLETALPTLPSIKEFRQGTNRLFVEQFAEATGQSLRELGINTIFYPSIDIDGNFPGRETLEHYKKFGTHLVKGLQKSDVVACLVNYPNKEQIDLHLRSDRKSSNVYPFYEILQKEAEMLQISTYSAPDINLYIRKHLSYDGLIVYDLRKEHDKTTITASFIRELLEAGVDLFLLPEGFNRQLNLLNELFEMINTIKEDIINKSFKKVTHLKTTYHFSLLEQQKKLTPYQQERLINRVKNSLT